MKRTLFADLKIAAQGTHSLSVHSMYVLGRTTGDGLLDAEAITHTWLYLFAALIVFGFFHFFIFLT